MDRSDLVFLGAHLSVIILWLICVALWFGFWIWAAIQVLQHFHII
jgi:hypothetical protein